MLFKRSIYWTFNWFFRSAIGEKLRLFIFKWQLFFRAITTSLLFTRDSQADETFLKRESSTCDIILDLSRCATLIDQLVIPSILAHESILFMYLRQMQLERIELVLRSHRQKVAQGCVFFPAELRMRGQLGQEVLYTKLAVEEWFWVFLLECEEGLLGWQHWNEKTRVFTANSLAEKVKIAVPALDLGNCPIGQKVELWGAWAIWLHIEFVVALVNHAVLVPAWTRNINTEPWF